jgi:hypothetical protein
VRLIKFSARYFGQTKIKPMPGIGQIAEFGLAFSAKQPQLLTCYTKKVLM